MLTIFPTSRSAQLWALQLLSQHPEVQYKLRQALPPIMPLPMERNPTVVEVDATATPCTSFKRLSIEPVESVVADYLLSVSMSVPDLEAVVHEILRLGEIAPGGFSMKQGQSFSRPLATNMPYSTRNILTSALFLLSSCPRHDPL